MMFFSDEVVVDGCAAGFVGADAEPRRLQA